MAEAQGGRVAQIAGKFWLGRIWMGRPWLRRSVLGVLALFAFVVLFAYFALPPILIAQTERVVAENVHRKMSIERIDVRPFALELSVHGVRLMEPDATTVFASFERFDVRISPASLVYLAPVIRELRLVGPYAHLVRSAPDHYSTDDIVAAFASAPVPPAPAASAPPRFALHNFRIEGGRFEFDDVPKSAHHVVSGFSLGVPFISTFSSQEQVFVEPLLAAQINGAPLLIRGKSRPFSPTPEYSVDLDFDDIDFARYLEYVPAAAQYRLPSGRLDVHLEVRAKLPEDKALQVHLAGKTTLKALELASADGKALLKLSELELAVASADLPSGHLDATVTINRTGHVSVAGKAALSPVHADLDVQVNDIDLLPLQPLIADRVNLRIARAELSGKGHLRLDQDAGGASRGDFQGDVALAKLATVDAVTARDLLSWDALNLRGLHVGFAPLAVHLDEAALKNFFARVIIDPSGRINLQDIIRSKSEAQRSITEAGGSGGAAREAKKGSTAAAPPAATSAPSAAAGPPVSIGKVTLQGGHVRFTDNFIKPKYSADLKELGGAVSGLSSDPASAAVVDLHGKVNDAPLLIGGRINPLARDLSFDIKASVHDMELAPLTSYSSKYVGYRIERGKLSFDVAYQLQNRQLHAENRLVLDQLTFGEKVESPSATSLPVRLAIALLKDRNGVIDINLPIGGSLDDPDFSVGGLIVKVLINLITKAVTAPFALLGDLFGGGPELSWLDFAPGQSTLSPAAETKLQSLASMMTQRPGLNLDITGWADPVADRDALRGARVQSKLRALKRQDLADGGALKDGAEVVVTPGETPELLARLYETEILGKPAAAVTTAGNPAGKKVPAKGHVLSPTQMEALRAHQQISDDDLLALGNRRAQEVKAWLKTVGMVPEERLSLVAAKIGPAVESPAGVAQGSTPETAAATAVPAAAGPQAAPAPASPTVPAPVPSASRVEFALR